MSLLEEPIALPEGIAPAAEVYSRAFLEGLLPDPDLMIWEWADKYRILPKETSAEPGPWDTNRTPFLREIMEALSPTDPTQEVALAKGTQLGGTEIGNNFIGYIIDVAPAPSMLVMPTSSTGKRSSKTRIDKMVAHTPVLSEKVAEKRSRDASNTLSLKEFPGGMLIVAGANSAAELSSSPVKNVFMDEVDSYPDDVDGEGPPEALAAKRTDTYVRKKIFKNSSVKGARGFSKIMRAFKAGDQRRAYVPCPHCTKEQVLVWEQMRWETRKVHEHKCEECGAISEVAAPHADQVNCPHCEHQVANGENVVTERDTGEVLSVHYECIHCAGEIAEHHKGQMFARGRWIAQAPGIGKAKTYHLSSLYSPLGWYSWMQAVRDFLAAEKDPTGKLKRAFWNTVLALEYDLGETEVVPDNIAARAERSYKLRTVPMGCYLLSAGVDVQKNRLEVKIKGWGRDYESWLIAWEPIYGDPLQDDVWDSLDDFICQAFPHASGQKIKVLAVGVDSGYLAQRVYRFCMESHHRNVLAFKGMEQSGRPVLGRPSLVDIDYKGQTIKQGTKLWPIGTDTAKTEIMARLAIAPPKVPGTPAPQYMHFPFGLPADYYEQLTAESHVRGFVKGREKMVWQKQAGRRNEALDCEVYAYAAAIQAGLMRTDWDGLEAFHRQTMDLFVEAQKRAEAEAAARAEEAAAAAIGAPEDLPEAPATPAETTQTSARPVEAVNTFSPPAEERTPYLERRTDFFNR